MVRTHDSIQKIGHEVFNFLSLHIKVEKLILFGSYLNKTQRLDSDIDMAVISADFAKMGVLKKINLLSKVPVAIDSRLELLGFTNKDFVKPEKISLLAFIKKTGQVLSQS